MPPAAESVSAGGWQEGEVFLLGLRPKQLLKAKYLRYKDFARKDGCGFKRPQIFYQEVIFKCFPTPHLNSAGAAG